MNAMTCFSRLKGVRAVALEVRESGAQKSLQILWF